MTEQVNVKVGGKWFKVHYMMREDMSMIPVEAVEEIMMGEVETERPPGPTQKELEAAFAKVRPKQNWKNPINAVIAADEDQNLIAQAISHFTGSASDFEVLPDGKVRVTAAGYYACIGA